MQGLKLRRIRADSPEIVERNGRKRRKSRERRESAAERNGEEGRARPNKMRVCGFKTSIIFAVFYFLYNYNAYH
ncbi:hypothetical protein BRARA_I03097 [Brassica rapa]|uniref:Transmembrane protein n=1 Tax=Brassica campestris TaxID=3711 RepID=A0A397XZN9_BRACM|nr:hypothetical protein BRARA_I03097 [Brassica rapa]